jgi:naphthoate synthase
VVDDFTFLFLVPSNETCFVGVEAAMLDEAARRLKVIEGQLTSSSSPQSQVERADTGSSSNSSDDIGRSSYARVHGVVSRAPATYRRIDLVAKELLQEVKYEKSEEGIAKVKASR